MKLTLFFQIKAGRWNVPLLRIKSGSCWSRPAEVQVKFKHKKGLFPHYLHIGIKADWCSIRLRLIVILNMTRVHENVKIKRSFEDHFNRGHSVVKFWKSKVHRCLHYDSCDVLTDWSLWYMSIVCLLILWNIKYVTIINNKKFT